MSDTQRAPRHTVIPAVHLFLMREGKVLLLRRFQTGYEDGKYSVPAGHVEADETSQAAMIREAAEEVGIRLQPSELQLVHVMYRNSPEANRRHLDEEPRQVFNERIDFFWQASSWQGEPQIVEQDKCDELRWVTPSELPANVIPYIAQAIQLSQAGQLYSELGYT